MCVSKTLNDTLPPLRELLELSIKLNELSLRQINLEMDLKKATRQRKSLEDEYNFYTSSCLKDTNLLEELLKEKVTLESKLLKKYHKTAKNVESISKKVFENAQLFSAVIASISNEKGILSKDEFLEDYLKEYIYILMSKKAISLDTLFDEKAKIQFINLVSRKYGNAKGNTIVKIIEDNTGSTSKFFDLDLF